MEAILDFYTFIEKLFRKKKSINSLRPSDAYMRH